MNPIARFRSRMRPDTRDDQRGAAAVELALVSVPMVLIFLAVFEFAFMLSRYHGISKRVYEAARYLSAPVIGVTESDLQARTQAMVLHGDPFASIGTPSGLKIAQNSITVCRCRRAAPGACPDPQSPTESIPPSCVDSTSNASLLGLRTVSVSVSGYTYSPIFPGLNYLNLSFPEIRSTMPRLQ
jgi:hypothetical protein